ncbi:MAG: PAS domain-containing protein, partial [Candidatus Helarchaeota archaeon]|nr:PAS domain-containing protein [Candidatus Helarchaeota archaeon]
MIPTRDNPGKTQEEQELDEAESRYKAIFNQFFYGVYIHDLNGNIIDANETALNMLGYSREEIPSIKLTSLMDKAQLANSIRETKYLLEHNSKGELVRYKLRRKDGRFIWVEIQGTLIYRQGKPYIQGIITDISQRIRKGKKFRESEEKSRLIAENVSDLIVITNDKFEIEYINESIHLKILGYSKSDCIGKVFTEMVHSSDHKMVSEKLNEGVFMGGGQIETRIRHKDGHFCWLEI